MMTSYTKKTLPQIVNELPWVLGPGFQVPLLNSKHVNGTSYRKWHLSLAQQGAMVGWSCNVIECHWKQHRERFIIWLVLEIYFFHLTWGDDQIYSRY